LDDLFDSPHGEVEVMNSDDRLSRARIRAPTPMPAKAVSVIGV